MGAFPISVKTSPHLHFVNDVTGVVIGANVTKVSKVL